MMITQVIITAIFFLAAGISNATPMPEPAPLDPGLQRVVAQKNGMGVVDSTKSAVNSALHYSEISLFAVLVPAIAANAASLLF
ncbi:hypothetical protein F5890DRAFT_149186 [Lentinula detonsa]|uniref:Uncharacterized protein n=1 Tax=Lentinula detonsa TaxID=2804962 RepID=A0AA38USN0_9AGAR|nr:hypothetical protein F5890DRAFT_149186 [Lentinula detonsa]